MVLKASVTEGRWSAVDGPSVLTGGEHIILLEKLLVLDHIY